MEPISLITTAVGVITQAAITIKGAKSLLDKYGDTAVKIGKSIFGRVSERLEENEKTRATMPYFEADPEERQQVITDALATLISQDEAFREELERLVSEYQQAVPVEALEETRGSVHVKVSIGGNVTNSSINTAGRDINLPNG